MGGDRPKRSPIEIFLMDVPYGTRANVRRLVELGSVAAAFKDVLEVIPTTKPPYYLGIDAKVASREELLTRPEFAEALSAWERGDDSLNEEVESDVLEGMSAEQRRKSRRAVD